MQMRRLAGCVLVLALAGCGAAESSRPAATTATGTSEFEQFCAANPGACDAPSPSARVEIVEGVSFADRDHGIAAVDRCSGGGCSQPLLTRDGGRTWRRGHVPGDGALRVLAQPHGLRFAARARALYRSADGGRSWQRTGIRGRIGAFTARDSGAWVVTSSGRRLRLWHSYDAGRSWWYRSLPSPPIEARADAAVTMAFANAADGALLHLDRRDGAVLLVTRDGGHSWARRPNPCGGLMSQRPPALSYAAGGALWVGCAGAGGAGSQGHAIYVSSDGGRHFELRARTASGRRPAIGNIGDLGYLDALEATSATDATVILTRAGVFATHDGGRRWRRLTGYRDPDRSQARQISEPAPGDRWLALFSRGLYHQRAGRWRRVQLGERR